MDPALLNYMQTIEAQQQQPQQYQGQQPQEQQQMQPQEGNSPFMSGANAAIQSAKQSLGMNAEEKNRAQGLAIMSFFTNLSKGGFGPGFNGRLAGITQSLNPAVQAYMQEQNNVAALNSQLGEQYQKQQQHQQMMQQKMMEHQAAQAHREAQLGETTRSHQTMEQLRAMQLGESRNLHNQTQAYQNARLLLEKEKLTNKEKKQLSIDQSVLEGGIPLASLDKNFTKEFYKTAHDSINSVDNNKRSLVTIKKMRDIFEKYPDIGTSFVNIVNAPSKDQESALTLLMQKFTDKDKLSAIQQLKKLSSDLNLATITGLKGQRPTDILKKEIQTAAPNGKLTYDAFDEIASSWEERAQQNIKKGYLYQNAIKTGIYPNDFNTEESPMAPQQPQVPEDVQWVLMRDSTTGEEKPVHPDDVGAAQANGAVRI